MGAFGALNSLMKIDVLNISFFGLCKSSMLDLNRVFEKFVCKLIDVCFLPTLIIISNDSSPTGKRYWFGGIICDISIKIDDRIFKSSF